MNPLPVGLHSLVLDDQYPAPLPASDSGTARPPPASANPAARRVPVRLPRTAVAPQLLNALIRQNGLSSSLPSNKSAWREMSSEATGPTHGQSQAEEHFEPKDRLSSFP